MIHVRSPRHRDHARVHASTHTLEKHLQPRNLVTLSGEGCAASMTWCLLRLMIFPFFCAKPPHRMKTIGLERPFSVRTTASVNTCHPHFSCELASCARTVSDALSMSTPRFAQSSRLPCCGRLKPTMSVSSSVKMFLRLCVRVAREGRCHGQVNEEERDALRGPHLGGTATPRQTLNESP